MTGAATAPAPLVDVLVPTAGRPGALAVTLTGLLGQDVPFRLVVSDQTPAVPSYCHAEAAGVVRVLRHLLPARAGELELHHRPERRGVAEQRAFLLSRARSAYALFLDDDILLEPGALARMLDAIRSLRCGLVGMSAQGLSYAGDVRPHEHASYEPVLPEPGAVQPERIRKGTASWARWRLHNAANLVHLAERVPVPERGWQAYKVAWIGGCVLYDAAALRGVGGFDFWPDLPPQQRGEDVVAQLRVIERYGGAGLLPSLAYHLEVPTTMVDRRADAYAIVLERADSAESALR